MKQKLLMMLAALMLMGTSAMAQSETLKGDVNGDGAVDVADIVAEVKIMKDNGDINTKYYFYIGQTEPTAENYTTLESIKQVTAYPTAYTYTTAIRGYVYILVADNYTISKIKDALNGFDVNYKEETSPITGYKLYKTGGGIAADFPITLQIK